MDSLKKRIKSLETYNNLQDSEVKRLDEYRKEVADYQNTGIDDSSCKKEFETIKEIKNKCFEGIECFEDHDNKRVVLLLNNETELFSFSSLEVCLKASTI